MPLFSARALSEQRREVRETALPVPAAVPADASFLEQPGTLTAPVSRAEWLRAALLDRSAHDDDGEDDGEPLVRVDIEEHVVIADHAALNDESSADRHGDPATAVQGVNLFSSALLERRKGVKRERADRRRVQDRDILANLCDGFSLSNIAAAADKLCTIDSNLVLCSLPAKAEVVPGPLTHRPHVVSHQRWVFEDTRDDVLAALSSRTKRRHPGAVRKLMRETPEMALVSVPVIEEPVAPVSLPAPECPPKQKVPTQAKIAEAIELKKKKSTGSSKRKPKNLAL